MKRERVIIALILLLGAVASYRLAAVPYHCNIVERRLEEATRRALREPAGEAAISARHNSSEVARAIERCPAVANFYMIAAANFRILRRFEEAEKMYLTALEMERRPEIYFQLATTQADLGKLEPAIENFSRACRFVPTLIDQVPHHLRDLVYARSQPAAGSAGSRG